MSHYLRHWGRIPQRGGLQLRPEYADARVWLPALGGGDVTGAYWLTRSATYGDIGNSPLGLTFAHTGADFNNGWLAPGIGTNPGSALVMVLAKVASSANQIYTTSGSTLTATSAAAPALATGGTTRCTSAYVAGDGSVIVAQSRTSDHALGHRAPGGHMDITRSSVGTGDGWATAPTVMNRYASTDIALLVQLPSVALSDSQITALLLDPINTLLKPRRVWLAFSSSSSDASASGSPAAISLVAATGSATGGAAAAGSPSALQLVAATGSATVGGVASGAPAALVLVACSGAATGGASASGAPAGITVAAADGAATGGAAATGAPAAISLTAAAGSATGAAGGAGAAAGSPAVLSLVPCTGSAAGGAAVSAPAAALSLVPCTGSASGAAGGGAAAAGAPASLALVPPAGSAVGGAAASGALPALYLVAATGAAAPDVAASLDQDRILVIAAELRTLAIEPENRTLVIEAENRTLRITR